VIEIVGVTVAVAAFDVARGVCVIVSVVDIDCVRETVGELLFSGIVTVVKELLGVNELLGVFDTGEADVVNDGGTLNVLRDDGDVEGCTVLVADRMGVKVDELRGLEDCPSDRVLRADID
jgi:hypothetical protein